METIRDKNLISLGDLAKELGVNKSKLAFYNKVGLIMPVIIAGKVFIFNRTDVLAKISTLINGKKTLKEVLSETKNENKKRPKSKK